MTMVLQQTRQTIHISSQFSLSWEDVQTADGTITVDSIRSILATEVRANGAGGISLTTTQGNIEILDVIAPGDLVTLDAQGFESSLHDESWRCP